MRRSKGHSVRAIIQRLNEELPSYDTLKPCRVVEYVPEWKRREEEKKTGADKTPPSPQPEPAHEEQSPAQETVNPAQGLEYTVEDTPKSSGGIGLIDMSGVRGDDESDEETDSPPGR